MKFGPSENGLMIWGDEFESYQNGKTLDQNQKTSNLNSKISDQNQENFLNRTNLVRNQVDYEMSDAKSNGSPPKTQMTFLGDFEIHGGDSDGETA